MTTKTAWNDWGTVGQALDEIVLVRFQFSDGKCYIEDSEIIQDEGTGEIVCLLLDGISDNVGVTPIQWMRIPD